MDEKHEKLEFNVKPKLEILKCKCGSFMTQKLGYNFICPSCKNSIVTTEPYPNVVFLISDYCSKDKKPCEYNECKKEFLGYSTCKFLVREMPISDLTK